MEKRFSSIPKCKNLCITYNRMSLKLRTRNHPSLQRLFSGMPLIPVPIYGVKMTSKPSKWLFEIKRRSAGTELETLQLDLFSFSFKIIFLALLGGGRLPPSLSPWIRHCEGLHVVMSTSLMIKSPEEPASITTRPANYTVNASSPVCTVYLHVVLPAVHTYAARCCAAPVKHKRFYQRSAATRTVVCERPIIVVRCQFVPL